MRTEDIEQATQGIAQVLSTPKITAALKRLLATAQQERLTNALERMLQKQAYVAVLGAQGTGKSSLLNSLIFNRRILPIGEGATTNIVCRIQDAAGGLERVDILLKSGEAITEPLEGASLKKYMDEAQNPGNARGVRLITCFANADLLRTNTSFVDTPGLGSLFIEQDAETMAFANQISLGLFVLRTTPPLMESEASFLRDVWGLCPEFVFVQNVWGESPTEVEMSTRDNLAKITAIAHEKGDNRAICLLSIDIHAGLEGVTNDRPQTAERAGLNRLKTTLESRIHRDGQVLEVVSRGRQIVLCLGLAIQAAQAEIVSLHSDVSSGRQLEIVEGLEQDLRDVLERSRDRETKYRQRVKELVGSFKRYLASGINGVVTYFREQIETTSGRSGVEDAFQDQLRHKIIDAADMFQNGFADICDAYITAAAGDLVQLDRALEIELNEVSGSVEDMTGTHIAEGAGKIAVTVGGIVLTALTGASAMTFAGTVAAGGGAMAGLAAAFATIPGPGWAIAGGIAAVGLIMRGLAREKRRNALLQAFNTQARKIEAEAAKRVSDEAERVSQRVITEVRKEVQAAVKQKESVAAKMRSGLASTQESKKETEVMLAGMIADLDAATIEVDRFVQSVQKS